MSQTSIFTRRGPTGVAIEYLHPRDFGWSAEKFIENGGRTAYRNQATRMKEGSEVPWLEKVVLRDRDHSVTEHSVHRIMAVACSDWELLDLAEINPFIRWVKHQGERHLLANGRHAIELFEIWKKAQQGCTKTCGSAPLSLIDDILSSLAPYYPTILAGYRGPGRPLRCGVTQWAHDFDANTLEELIVLTYKVTGFSRVTEVQEVRHRMRSYTVMSGRGVDFRDQPVKMPPSFNKDPALVAMFKALVEQARAVYIYAKDNCKMPPGDARYATLQGITSEMVVTAALPVWNLFFPLRNRAPAQWEVQEGCNLIQHDAHQRLGFPRVEPAPTIYEEVVG